MSTNDTLETSAEAGVNADWLGLHGARVLIAGAGGIGGACALAYARSGASVAVVDRDQRALDALGEELTCPRRPPRADPGRPHRARLGRAGRRPGRRAAGRTRGHAARRRHQRPPPDPRVHRRRVGPHPAGQPLVGLRARAGGRPSHGRAGLRPRARAVERLGPARAPLARPVRGIQGRHQPAAARHGARVGGIRRDRERTRARLHRDSARPLASSPSPASGQISRASSPPDDSAPPTN